jgi:hypothetical protein
MKGLDLSFSEGSAAWWKRRFAEGYRVAVQDLWTGGSTSEGFRGIAARNLRRAREAGFIVCGYTNVAPWNSGKVAFDKAVEFAEDEWPNIAAVFVDVEIAAHNGQSIREADIRQCLELVTAAGKRTAIYSAQWFWVGHLGNPLWQWLREYQVWNANYDGDPDVDFSKAPWGPWVEADIMGEQFQGSTDIEGVTVDLNEFRDGFFAANAVGAATVSDQEEDMPKLFSIIGRPEVYQYNGGSLEHVPNRQVLRAAGLAEASVVELKPTDPLLDLPVTYRGGVPQQLR